MINQIFTEAVLTRAMPQQPRSASSFENQPLRVGLALVPMMSIFKSFVLGRSVYDRQIMEIERPLLMRQRGVRTERLEVGGKLRRPDKSSCYGRP